MKKLKNIVVIVFIIYAMTTFMNQEKVLSSYKEQEQQVANEIEEAKEYQEELNISKENANSLEYIEQVAREKLNMYYPNEKIYVDNSK
jgi:cell division protein FtsB